ncbi:MAG: hypothetical protein AAGC97_11935 [Planctomycetota bacterium]
MKSYGCAVPQSVSLLERLGDRYEWMDVIKVASSVRWSTPFEPPIKFEITPSPTPFDST